MFLTASAKGRSAPPSCLIAVIVVSWLDVYPTAALVTFTEAATA